MQAAIQRSNRIRTRFSKVFTNEQAEVLSDTIRESYRELVKVGDFKELKGDFKELKGIVKNLAVKMGELADAQKRTENRLEELADAQKRTENRLEELAEAQTGTENRVEQLAEAQTRTENRVEQLADIQTQMQIELRGLAEEHKETRRLVGGLSESVGYGLEDKIMPYMTDFVKKNYGIDAVLVSRENLIYPDGKFDELNIYVQGTKEGKKAFVIGECKAQPAKKDAIKFDRLIKRASRVLKGEIFVFLAGYSFDPVVKDYIRENYPDIEIFQSYEFQAYKFELKDKRTRAI